MSWFLSAVLDCAVCYLADVTARSLLWGSALPAPFGLIERIFINNQFENTWEIKQ
jgi:hypothetical protein